MPRLQNCILHWRFIASASCHFHLPHTHTHPLPIPTGPDPGQRGLCIDSASVRTRLLGKFSARLVSVRFWCLANFNCQFDFRFPFYPNIANDKGPLIGSHIITFTIIPFLLLPVVLFNCCCVYPLPIGWKGSLTLNQLLIHPYENPDVSHYNYWGYQIWC